jgi:hypothetical protein
MSIRFVRKGALVRETYATARQWDWNGDVASNMQRVKRDNVVGARSTAWLDDVVVTLGARFRAGQGLAPLITLAQGGYPQPQWRDCLHWHLGLQDALWFAFLHDWLYPAYTSGIDHIGTADVEPFVLAHTEGRAANGKGLTERSRTRVAQDLLRMATEFGLLKGKAVRTFTSYLLSDESLLYVLHALAEREGSAQRIIEASEWRMYLMRPADVEHALLRLHQFQRLEYYVAGSIMQLRLPYHSLQAYAESLTQ